MNGYKLRISLGILLLCITTIVSATTPINGKYYVSQWSSPALHNALVELNALNAQVTLVIDEAITLTQPETVDPEIKLEFTAGGNFITIPSNYILTIQSPVSAGFYQIFYVTGNGSVIVPGEKHIEWWGAVTGEVSSNQQTINTNAFQSALDNQGLITFTSAIYKFNNRVRMKAHTILQGSGKSRLKWTHAGIGIDLYNCYDAGFIYCESWGVENWAIRDLGIEGSNDGYAGQTSGNVGLLLGVNADSQRGAVWGGTHIERVVFYMWGDAAIKCNGCVWSLAIQGCRFAHVYSGIYITDTQVACSDSTISKCVFDYIGNDCLYATNTYGVIFGSGNVTEQFIKGYYTHFVNVDSPYVYGNLLENQTGFTYGTSVYGHYWEDVRGGTFQGMNNEDNIYLKGNCFFNDIKVISTQYGWKCAYGSPYIAVPGVFEDITGGCRDNKIVAVGGNAGYGIYGYSTNSLDIKSEIHEVDKSATNVTITTVLTAATINYPNPGKYLLDTTSNSIIVNLPQACTNPFAEWTFVYYTKSGSNTVTIVPGTDSNSIDGGIIDKYASNYVLRNEGDRVTVKAVPTLITYIGNLKYLGRYWYSLDKKLTNTFNTANAVSTTVTDGNVRISSVIEIYPINATAAGLQGSSKCLYLDSIGNGTFTVKTADNTATGTTTAQFKYVVR